MGLSWSTWASTLEPVENISLERFAGRWYQVAALPAWFQSPDARDVVATYALAADGVGFAMRNEETRADGTHVSIDARAELDPACRDDGACGRLLVVFSPSRAFPSVSAKPAPYWVIQLADDYRYAVVSEPRRRFLWVLSRTPTLADADYTRIVALLSGSQGFTPEMLAGLVRTHHTAAIATPPPPAKATASVKGEYRVRA